jgi:hypothetical protein
MRAVTVLNRMYAPVAGTGAFFSRYAALGYETTNIGDDIQTLAAMRYFPARPALVQRERLHQAWHPFRPYKMILNGWFMHRPENWPPSASIDPLVLSVHLANVVSHENRRGIVPVDHLLAGKNLEWFRRMARLRPVGARDLHTLSALRAAGVDAYFSGCLTLTLPRIESTTPSGEILAVDLDARCLEVLRQMTRERLRIVTHHLRPNELAWRRNKLARALLRRYAAARAVVTSRLHAALPCLALGTPVLFVHCNLDDPRFGGLIEHLHRASLDDFTRKRLDFDVRAPPPNPDTWKPLARDLARRCEEFIAGD